MRTSVSLIPGGKKKGTFLERVRYDSLDAAMSLLKNWGPNEQGPGGIVAAAATAVAAASVFF